MLIIIFLGIFGMWMAFLTVFQFYWHDGARKNKGVEKSTVQAVVPLRKLGLKNSAEPNENSSFALAVKDLWNEVMKGTG